MPKFTDEQVERAKNVDVRTFLEKTEGYVFQQHGRYLKCQNPEQTGQPSSLTIDTNLNRIFYNSETGKKPLSALDWCKEIRDLDFQSSMQLILGESPHGERAEKPKFHQHISEPINSVSKELNLPEKSDTSKNVYAYLTKTRGIPANIVNDCLKNGTIYQDERRNAVFVGYDDNKQAKYAARRGTFTPDGKEPFKRDCSGSDKKFAFKLEGKSTDTVYVAEAAIDALSLAALEDKFNGSGAYKEKTYISTGGAGIDNALEQFCKTHDVKTINICFDDDEAGKSGMENIMKKFREKGYEVNDMRATLAHDYNDELVKFNNDPKFYKEPPITVRPPETVVQKQNDVNIETKTAATENKRNDIMPEITSTEKPEIENSEKPEIPNSEKPEIAISDKPEIPNSVKSEIANPVKPEIPPSKKKESSEIQSSVIFGNTGYSKIPDKEHITNIEPSIAVNLFDRLQQENIQFSGKFAKDGLVIAASKDNVDKVNAMIREETALLRKREEQELSIPDIPKEVKSEQTVSNPEPRKENHEAVSDKALSEMSQEQKVNFLLSSAKNRQEHKRADLLDKIDRIDSKIADRQQRIEKLNDKISDIELSLKTSAAFKLAFGNTPIGKLIDRRISKQQAKIEQIQNEKIPKHEAKIEAQNAKKDKVTSKLGKVNRKIDTIDKVQDFFSALSSKDKVERHTGFITGLENLSAVRRESLENKLHKTNTRIDMLSAKYSSPEIPHSERLNIKQTIHSLRKKADVLSSKIEGLNKLNGSLDDMKNGRFTESEVETSVAKTADKINEQLVNANNQEEKGIINNFVAVSVEAGNEAIAEVMEEKTVDREEKIDPVMERERLPEEQEPNVTEDTEQKIITAVAAVTGIALSELNRLPVDIKSDIISEFQQNNGNIAAEQLTERICEIADIEPPEIIKPAEPEIKPQENKEKENPLRELEDLLEENDNYFDGMLNNLPPEKPVKQEREDSHDEPLLSRSRIMSNDFKPLSEKSNEDIEKSNNKKHDLSI